MGRNGPFVRSGISGGSIPGALRDDTTTVTVRRPAPPLPDKPREAVLAEVRAGIEAIPSTPWFKADALDAIDALAVLDRARNGGEQS